MARSENKFVAGQRVAVKRWTYCNPITYIRKVRGDVSLDDQRVGWSDSRFWYLVRHPVTKHLLWMRENDLEKPVTEQVVERWRRGDI